MSTEQQQGAASSDKPKLPKWVMAVGGILLFLLLIPLIMRLISGATGGLFRGSAVAQETRAEAKLARVESKAEARAERQERKDVRLAIRSARKERRACRKAARGVKRRGGARKRARAECQRRFAETVRKLREEGLSASAADGADDNS